MTVLSQPSVSRAYAGTPACERRAQRREQLLAAGLQLFGTDGYASTTVRTVCAEARLNQRYLYESFGSLDMLLVAVFDRVVGEASDAVLRVALGVALGEADVPARTRAAVERLVLHLTDDPRRARVLFLEAPGCELLARRRLTAMQGLSRLIEAQASASPAAGDEVSVPLIEATTSMLAGGISQLLISWLDGRIAMTRDELIDALYELAVATGESALGIARRRARDVRVSSAA